MLSVICGNDKSINFKYYGGELVKKIVLALVASAALAIASAGHAQAGGDIDFDAVKKEGDTIVEIPYDLDGDKTDEKVILKAYCLEKYENEIMSFAGQLIVMKKEGESYKTIWEGPKIDKEKLYDEQKFRFIFGQGGMEEIELFGEVYGDKTARLISPSQKSDVSPSLYRVYAWKGDKFEFEKSGYLFDSPDGPGVFKWSDNRDGKGLWVLYFEKMTGTGAVEARICRYDEKEGGASGKALLKYNGNGFSVVEWIEKLKNNR